MSVQNLLLADERLGWQVFSLVHHHPLLIILAEIFSVSGDEIIWIGIPSVVGSFLTIICGFGSLGPMGCVEEGLWDCYGACATCTFCECFLKCIFCRTRPSYLVQSMNYCVHGEWFSFPSGHSMRAFYAIFYFTRSTFVSLVAPYVVFPNALYLVPWAAGVGLSRVAKGKHYPLDVVVGALVGVILGYFVEDQATAFQRGIIKTITGTYGVFNFGIYCLVPLVQDGMNDSTDAKAVMGSKMTTLVTFYSFAVLVFMGTLASSNTQVGAQTITWLADGSAACTNLW